MTTPKVSLLAAVLASALSGNASANAISLSNITAEWYDGNPVANVSYVNNPSTVTASARWGVGAAQSGYDFTIAAQPINFTVPPSPSPAQQIGEFTHLNFPIASGTSITAAAQAQASRMAGIQAPANSSHTGPSSSFSGQINRVPSKPITTAESMAIGKLLTSTPKGSQATINSTMARIGHCNSHIREPMKKMR